MVETGNPERTLADDSERNRELERLREQIEAVDEELVALIGRGAASAGRANVERIMADIVDYHTTPIEVAEIARDAGVRHLLYYHVVPPLPLAPLEDVFLDGVDAVYGGPIHLGRDGLLLSLPAGSDAIEEKELL